MADQNSIKTIMSVDNSDVTEKLKQLDKYYKDTFSGWIESTDKLKQKDAELAKAKGELVVVTRSLKEEQAKGEKASKEEIASLKEIVKSTKDKVQILGLEKKAIQATTQAIENEIATSKKLNSELIKLAKTKESIPNQTPTIKEENEALRKQYNELYTNAKALEAHRIKIEQLNLMRSRGVITQSEYNEAIKKEKQSLEETTPARDSQFNHFIRMARWGGTLIGVYYAVSTAWSATIGKGVELGRQLEDMSLGVAALTAANANNISSTGNLLTPMEKFRMATALTAETMVKLKKIANETPGSFTDLVAIFQQSYAQTAAMGQGFGKTLNEVNANTLEFSKRMANIAGSMGMPMQKALEEARSLLSGQASGDSLVASLLFGSPAQANEAIRQAKTKGPNAVKDLVMGMTDAFAPLEKVPSYTKSITNAQGAYETLITAMASPVKNDLQRVFDEFTKTFDSGTKQGKENLDSLIHGFDSLYSSIKNVAGVISTLSKPIISTLVLSGDGWGKIFKLVEMLYTSTNGGNNTFERYIGAYFKSGGPLGITAEIIDDLTKKRSKAQPKANSLLTDLMTTLSSVSGKPTTTTPTGSLTQKIDATWLADATSLLKTAPSTKDNENKRLRELLVGKIKEYQNAISILSKDGITSAEKKEIDKSTGLIDTAKKAIAEIDRLSAEERGKNAKSAITDANKAAREELSDLEKLKAKLAAQSAKDTMLEAEKAIEGLDAQKLAVTDLQKHKLEGFKETLELQQKYIDADKLLKDADNREYKINQDSTKLYETRTEMAKFILQLSQGQTVELEKQNRLLGQKANQQLQDELRALANSTKRDKSYTPMARAFGKNALSPQEAQDAIDIATQATQAKIDELQQSARMNGGLVDDKAISSAEEKLTQFTESIKNRIAEIPDVSIDIKLQGWDNVSNSIAGLVNSFSALNNANDIYNTQMKVSTQTINKLKAEGKDYTEEERKRNALIHKNAYDTIEGYAGMIGAVSGFYDAQSSQAKKLHEVENALHAVKMAAQLAEMVQHTASTDIFVTEEVVKTQVAAQTAVAVAAQSSPWTGIATAASMIALLASVGIMLGVGGNGTVEKYDAFSAQKANTGTGTVLGDTEAQSKSITNSLTTLKDFAKPQYQVLSNMDKNLSYMASNIGGLASNIIRKGGYMMGGGFTPSSSNGTSISQGLVWSSLGLAASTGGIGLVTYGASELLKAAIGKNFVSDLIGGIGNFVGGTIGSIFGGATKKSLSDYGLALNQQSLLSALSGVSGQSYQTIKTHKDGGWFGSSSNRYNTQFSALDSEVSRQFTLILSNMYDTVVSSGKAMDTAEGDITSRLNSFVVDLGKISFKGKTGDQIQTELESIFGATFDKITATIYPELVKFQHVGEGLGDTLTRVATGMESAGYYIDKLGSSFKDISYLSVINTQGDIGLEALRQSIEAVDKATYGANNGVIKMLDTFNGSASDLYDTYVLFQKLRANITLTGQSSEYLTSAMITGAGGVNELATAQDTFFTNFFSNTEQFKFNQEQLAKEFDKLGLVMPTSKEAFRSLVESIDVSTESGQKLYGQVMLLAGGYNDLSTAQADVYSGVKNLSDAFGSLGDSISQTIDQLTGIASGSSTREQIAQFWDKKSQLDTLLAKNGDLTPTEQTKLGNLVSGLNQLSTSLAQTDPNLANSLISTLGNIKSGLAVDQATLVSAYGGTTTANEVGVLTALKGLLPSYDVGTSYVPNDQIAMIHKGEMVIDAQSSAVARKYGIGGLNILGTGGVSEFLSKISNQIGNLEAYLQRMDRNLDTVIRGNALTVSISQ